nr:hypothetical protein BgiMline_020960 [Biomphalaria glabrata]
MMAMCVRYFISHRQEEDEASYVSINFNEDGSGAETDNTYESIKSRYFEEMLIISSYANVLHNRTIQTTHPTTACTTGPSRQHTQQRPASFVTPNAD